MLLEVRLTIQALGKAQNANVERTGHQDCLKGQNRKVDSNGMDGAGGNRRLCRDGTKCSAGGKCSFSHDIILKPCRYGDNCTKLELGKCLFEHKGQNLKGANSDDMSRCNRCTTLDRWLANSKNGDGRA